MRDLECVGQRVFDGDESDYGDANQVEGRDGEETQDEGGENGAKTPSAWIM